MKGSLVGVSGKEYVCHTDNVRDTGSIPSLGRSPGGGHGNSPQYFLACRIPWTEEPGGLESIGSQRVKHA